MNVFCTIFTNNSLFGIHFKCLMKSLLKKKLLYRNELTDLWLLEWIFRVKMTKSNKKYVRVVILVFQTVFEHFFLLDEFFSYTYSALASVTWMRVISSKEVKSMVSIPIHFTQIWMDDIFSSRGLLVVVADLIRQWISKKAAARLAIPSSASFFPVLSWVGMSVECRIPRDR